MSNFEILKKVFSRVDQFWKLLLKCCKREKTVEKVVTEAKNGSGNIGVKNVSLI